MNNDEMLRLACIYAEEDRSAFLDAIADCRTPEDEVLRAETRAFIAKLRAYRIKKWGRTQNEAALDHAISVPVALINGSKENT